MIKNNVDFIKKYGVYEFRSLCDYIQQDLLVLNLKKEKIRYKINHTKKRIKIINKNNNVVYIDFSVVFTTNNNELKEYIKELCDNV